MNTIKMILFIILAVILTVVIPFSGILMPLFLALSTALFVAIAVKWHVLYTIFSATFSGLLIYFILTSAAAVSGIVAAIIFPIIPLISSLAIFIALKNKASMKTLLLSGTTGLFALIAVMCLVYGGGFVADVINIAKAFMLETLDSVMLSLPTESTVTIEEMKLFYNSYFETLKVVAPGIILSFIFMISYFSIKLANVFAKNELELSVVPPFSEIRSPAFFIIIAVAAYFGQTMGNPFISGLMANLFMLLTVYLTTCGYSFLDFLVKPRVKSIFGRIIIYLVITFLLTLISSLIYFANPVIIAMFIGVADSMFNYRAKIRMLRGK